MKMKFARPFIVSSLCVIALSGIGKGAAADCVSCGDANGDGVYSVADIAYLTAFLYAGGPAPAECADIDGYDLITIRDLVVGTDLIQPQCVTLPKIVPQPTSNYEIDYDVGWSSASTYRVGIDFWIQSSDVASRIKAFDLPLSVKVDGQIPISLSVNWNSGVEIVIDSTLGVVLVSSLDRTWGVGRHNLFDLTIGVAPPLGTHTITLEYAEVAPTMSGVFAPPNSACHYVMFLDANLNAWKPDLFHQCRCGDADNNGIISISDCVFLINYVFADGPAPIRVCQGDSDGNSIITISDAVFLIGYIFAGGPAPSGC